MQYLPQIEEATFMNAVCDAVQACFEFDQKF
jgi:hypothetical protein